jgi:hypothetical protein
VAFLSNVSSHSFFQTFSIHCAFAWHDSRDVSSIAVLKPYLRGDMPVSAIVAVMLLGVAAALMDAFPDLLLFPVMVAARIILCKARDHIVNVIMQHSHHSFHLFHSNYPDNTRINIVG